jgi:hypothetical protein
MTVTGAGVIVVAHSSEALPIYELPLPLGLTLLACAVAVAASFVVVAFKGGDTATLERKVLGASFARGVTTLAQLAGLALLLIFVTEMGSVVSNVTTVGVSPIPLAFWAGAVIGGVVLASVVDGIWRVFAPLWPVRVTETAEAHSADGHAGNGHAGDGHAGGLVRKAAVSLVAPVLLYALFWFELVSGVGFSAVWVSLVVLFYCGLALVARTDLGRSWGVVDPLSALFDLAGRAAPLRLERDGLYYKGWLKGLVGETPIPVALCATLFVLLGATTLDNARETTTWSTAVSQLNLDGAPGWLVDSAALLLAALVFFFAFRAAVSAAHRWIGRDLPLGMLVRRFSWSLIPIALAYLLAHNFMLFASGIPLLIGQLLDPLGLGWDPLGAREALLSIVPSSASVWFAEIVLVVGGHVLAVAAAHRTAVRLSTSREEVLWSQLPLTLLMCGYTVATLALLAQPLV